MIINLADYKDPDIHMILGRRRGEAIRKVTKLDRVDISEEVFIELPKGTITTITFWLGLLGPSVRLHGEESFRKMYTINNIAEDDLERTIEYALQTTSPLEWRA